MSCQTDEGSSCCAQLVDFSYCSVAIFNNCSQCMPAAPSCCDAPIPNAAGNGTPCTIHLPAAELPIRRRDATILVAEVYAPTCAGGYTSVSMQIRRETGR